jgi:hypothetical protein
MTSFAINGADGIFLAGALKTPIYVFSPHSSGPEASPLSSLFDEIRRNHGFVFRARPDLAAEIPESTA